MGKIGHTAIRLVSSLDPSDEEEILIWCPFLTGLEPTLGMWLGPLAWHDCNGALFSALATSAMPARATVFAGVFCNDPFRLDDDILRVLLAAGVAGVANLPSVSFLDGDFGQTLTAMNLGVEREIAFLRHARSAGLRVAGCAGALANAETLVQLGAELIIVHSGPPIRTTFGGRTGQGHLAGQLRNGSVQTIELLELLSGLSNQVIARDNDIFRVSNP